MENEPDSREQGVASEDETPEKPDEVQEKEERNGSIFAWLLARIRTERPENTEPEPEEPPVDEVERVIEEAEEAIAEAEDVVELRHEHEAELLEIEELTDELDYEAEWAHAEVVRGETREIIDRVAIVSDSYPDYEPSLADAPRSPVPASPASATEKHIPRPRKPDTIAEYFRLQKQQRLEKKLKKEVARHKKQLKKLEKKVNKVQEVKIKKLVGRISDLETDKHENHFEPRHVERPVNTINERVVRERTVVTQIEKTTEKTKDRSPQTESTKAKKSEEVKPKPVTAFQKGRHKDSSRQERSIKGQVTEVSVKTPEHYVHATKPDLLPDREGAQVTKITQTVSYVAEKTLSHEPSHDNHPQVSMPKKTTIGYKKPVYWTFVGLAAILVAILISQI